MKRAACYIVILLIFTAHLFANIAAPSFQPPGTSDMFSMPQSGNPLRIEKETLLLDITGADPATSPCFAEYTIVNPTSKSITMPMLFLTPGAQSIAVSVNGVPLAAGFVTLPTESVEWFPPLEEWEARSPDYGAARFEATFPPGARTIVRVEFRLSRGYNNTSVAHGPTYPQSAHMLNLSNNGNTVWWYRYDLFAAKSFSGGFGTLELTVRAPAKDEIICNLALSRPTVNADTDTMPGVAEYSGTFDGIPSAFVDIKHVIKQDYHCIGATIGAGCAFPFDGRDFHFSARLLADLFFENHQISAGIETDPFSGLYHALLLYTLYPGGRVSGYGGLFDIRGGVGVAFDLASGFSPGFRVFGGVRLMPIAYVLSYEIFPFIETGEVHELAIMIEVSL